MRKANPIACAGLQLMTPHSHQSRSQGLLEENDSLLKSSLALASDSVPRRIGLIHGKGMTRYYIDLIELNTRYIRILLTTRFV